MGRSSTSLPDHGGVLASSPRLPSVSVVVPYAGPARYLATVLQAILESDYPKRLLQLVVVECPQSGGQPPIWARVARSLSCSWIHHHGPGFAPASARNAGVVASDGHLIVGLDGDMVVQLATFARMPSTIWPRAARWPSGFDGLSRFPPRSRRRGVFCRLAGELGIQDSASNRIGHVRDWRSSHLRELAVHAAPYELALGCNLAYERAAAVDVGGWSTAFDGFFDYEDIEFASRLSRSGRELIWTKEATALHLEDARARAWKVDRARTSPSRVDLFPVFVSTVTARSGRVRPGEA